MKIILGPKKPEQIKIQTNQETKKVIIKHEILRKKQQRKQKAMYTTPAVQPQLILQKESEMIVQQIIDTPVQIPIIPAKQQMVEEPTEPTEPTEGGSDLVELTEKDMNPVQDKHVNKTKSRKK